MLKNQFKFILLIFLSFIIAFNIPLNANAIKIGLYENVKKTSLASSGEAYLINGKTGERLFTFNKMKYYDFKTHRGNIAIIIEGQTYNTKTNNVVITSKNPNDFLCAKNRWYRGNMMIKLVNGGLTVINDLSLEDYLKGVVPSEMPSGWNIEAQKAQAIAARSYAIANLGKRSSYGYDLKDTPEDQAYGGASSETVKTNNAVEQTKGIVLTYNKKVIPAFYCASAGGQTKASGDVWYEDLPFLKSVPSFDEHISKNGHGVGMSQHGANNLAKMGYNAYQILNYFYSNTHFGKLDSSWKI